MKKFRLLLLLPILASVALFSTSCSDDDNGPSRQNLLDTANASGLTTFAAAVELSGLQDTFTGTAKFTVFGPTNSAMDEYLITNGYSSINAVPVATLKELVRNHIINGDVDLLQFNTGYKKTLAVGPASSTSTLSLFVNVDSGVMLNGVASITTADIRASNGRIHIVDKVVPMPSLYTHLLANPELTSIAAGFGAGSGYVSLLSTAGTDAPYTLFAPTNDAMTSFLSELGYDGYGDFPAADLEKILGYHIHPQENALYATLTGGLTVNTLTTSNFTISSSGGGKKINDANGRFSNFTTTRDVQATNGVLHVIDKALLPNL